MCYAFDVIEIVEYRHRVRSEKKVRPVYKIKHTRRFEFWSIVAFKGAVPQRILNRIRPPAHPQVPTPRVFGNRQGAIFILYGVVDEVFTDDVEARLRRLAKIQLLSPCLKMLAFAILPSEFKYQDIVADAFEFVGFSPLILTALWKIICLVAMVARGVRAFVVGVAATAKCPTQSYLQGYY